VWSVILELDDRPPVLLAECERLDGDDGARAVALEAAIIHNHVAGRVCVSNHESSDQIQRYGPHREHVIRDQPHLPAHGQDVTVVVGEPAHVIIRPGR
jgi:hypothetical protein